LAVLVEESFTCCCTAEARNTICTSDLTFEFVIVGEFLVFSDISQCIDDNSFALVHRDDLSRAVGHTTVVDEPSNTTLLRCIHDGILIDSEEVTASNSALEITVLTKICDLLSDFLTNVLDDHVIHSNVLHGIQTPVVNGRSLELDKLLSLLQLVKAKNIIDICSKRLLLTVEVSGKCTLT